jgi:hypothetical protein
MLSERAFFDEARAFMEDRRGRILFVGGDPTEMVFEYVDAGRFVSVCNPTAEAATKLREGLATRKAERMVTLDPRSYAEVTFEMSAFDGIVMTEMGPGIPNAKVLFKKVKHDLKMGSRVITQIAVRRDQKSNPRTVKGLRLLDRVAGILPTEHVDAAEAEGAWCRKELVSFAEKYLKVHELRYLGALPSASLDALPQGINQRIETPDVAAALAKVPGWVSGCTSVLVKLANENDFGTVFMKHVTRR